MTDSLHELRETCNAFRDGEQRALAALQRARESNQRLSSELHTKTLECGHARVKLLQLARHAQRFLELLETGAPGIVDAKRELNARVGAALADQPAATKAKRNRCAECSPDPCECTDSAARGTPERCPDCLRLDGQPHATTCKQYERW